MRQGVGVLLLLALPVLVFVLPPAVLLWTLYQRRATGAAPPPPAPRPLDWRADHEEYFSTSSDAGQARRDEAAAQVLAGVCPERAHALRAHVKEARGLAVYGCGILAGAR